MHEINYNRVLEEALNLAEHGIKVIPLHGIKNGNCTCSKGEACRTPGKHPIHTNWASYATHDTTIISNYLRDEIRNIGVPMGSVNGIFALDFDFPHGMDTYQEWMEWLTPTVEVETGSGARQLWYKVPKGIVIPNSVKKIGRDVDLRGEGGQSVAPGSDHYSGGIYRFLRSPDDIEVAEAPSHLLEKIAEISKMQQEALAEGIKVDDVPITIDFDAPMTENIQRKIVEIAQKCQPYMDIFNLERNYDNDASRRDLAIANYSFMYNMTPQEVTDLIINFRRERNEDLKHALYYQLTIGKGMKYASTKVSVNEVIDEDDLVPLPKIPEVEEFPSEIFPRVVRDYVSEISRGMNAPKDVPGLHAMTILGGAIGKSYQVEIFEGWTQYANLFTCVVSPPGTKKSPVLKKMFKPTETLANEYLEEYRALKDEYETRLNEYNKEMKSFKKLKHADEEEKPTEPQPPKEKRLWASGITTEALFRRLQYNPRGLILVMDELSALVKGMNQYKGGKGDDRSQFLSLFSNTTIQIDRVSMDEPIDVPEPFLSVTGNLTPAMLPLVDGREAGDGFAERFLIVYPEQLGKHKLSRKGISTTLASKYDKLIRDLYDMRPAHYSLTKVDANVIPLHSSAWDIFDRYYDKLEELKEEEDISDRLIAIYNKYPDQLARVALILHITRFKCGEEEHDAYISAESMHLAVKFMEYCRSHAIKVHDRIQTTREDQEIEKAIAWIKKRGGRVTKRDICRGKVCGIQTASKADRLLRSLVDRRYGAIEEEVAKNGATQEVFVLKSE